MDARLLTDSIVRQTTVLIAQISTAAGIRAPLSQIADQVFLSLSQELERQGVSRKVVADMFGLALRSYQRKVQRLEESGTNQNKTLWEAVLEFIESEASVTRPRVLERFKHDEEASVIAVLGDLVSSGLVSASGRGSTTLYRVTSEVDRKAMQSAESLDTLSHLVWGEIFRQPNVKFKELASFFSVDPERLQQALSSLIAEGRIEQSGTGEGATFKSGPFLIPVGSQQGWEAAVFDHFQAMANAVAAKLRDRGETKIGGATLHFGVHPQHPLYQETLETLTRVRAQLNELWNKVVAHNDQHPHPEPEMTRVTVYLGQNVREPEGRE
jgi:hypothetical protein